MTPEQIEFLTIIEEMRAPTARILTWADRVRTENASQMTGEHRENFGHLQSSAARLQRNLSEIIESPLIPAEAAEWGELLFELTIPVGCIRLAEGMLSKMPLNPRSDWWDDLQNIRAASFYVFRLLQDLRHRVVMQSIAEFKGNE